MASKLFINYRRSDARAEAARLYDRLTQAFGTTGVFMDVDKLVAGQRFDKELELALAQSDVFLAVIGHGWMTELKSRLQSGERDFVREEIAAALTKGTSVIPILIERTPLPHVGDLPEDIRELVMHQKHDVAHESFGRDVAALVDAIKASRKETARKKSRPWRQRAIAAVGATGLAAAIWLTANGYLNVNRQLETAAAAKAEAERILDEAKAKAEEAAEKNRKVEQRAREKKPLPANMDVAGPWHQRLSDLIAGSEMPLYSKFWQLGVVLSGGGSSKLVVGLPATSDGTAEAVEIIPADAMEKALVQGALVFVAPKDPMKFDGVWQIKRIVGSTQKPADAGDGAAAR